MHRIPFVRGSALLPFVQLLQQIGAPAERRLAEFRIPVEALHLPEKFVPLGQAFMFLERNARSEGLANLGTLVANRIRFEDFGAFGRVVRQSITLHDALAKTAVLLPKLNSAHRLWLEPWQNQIRVCHCYVGSFGAERMHADQFTLSMLIKLIGLVGGPQWSPSEIHVDRQIVEPTANSVHGKLAIPGRVSAIVFDRQLLARPLRKLMGNHNYDRDREFLMSVLPASTFIESVYQLVELHLRDDQNDIKSVAALFGLSIRSYQRRLAEAGYEFSDIVASVRFKTASKLLADHTIPVADIAHEVGYSDAANFTRAFRRWAGMSPSAYRNTSIGRGSSD